jgi:hypothetical protein
LARAAAYVPRAVNRSHLNDPGNAAVDCQPAGLPARGAVTSRPFDAPSSRSIRRWLDQISRQPGSSSARSSASWRFDETAASGAWRDTDTAVRSRMRTFAFHAPVTLAATRSCQCWGAPVKNANVRISRNAGRPVGATSGRATSLIFQVVVVHEVCEEHLQCNDAIGRGNGFETSAG